MNLLVANSFFFLENLSEGFLVVVVVKMGLYSMKKTLSPISM